MAHTTVSFSAVVIIAAATLIMPLSAGAAAATPEQEGMPGCNTTCGNLRVPYPFGMGPPSCYWPGFNLTCDTRSNPPQLLLGDGTLLAIDYIDLQEHTVTVRRAGDMKTYGNGSDVFDGSLRDDGPYALKSGVNELILTGCNVRATLRNGNITIASCSSLCEKGSGPSDVGVTPDDRGTYQCSGRGCCQADIIINHVEAAGKHVYITSYDVQLEWLGWNTTVDKKWPATVFVTMKGWFEQKQVFSELALKNNYSSRDAIAVLGSLDWEVFGRGAERNSNITSSESTCPTDAARNVCKSEHSECKKGARGGYTCSCKEDYRGNPYIIDGCKDYRGCNQPGGQPCYGDCTNTAGGWLYECRCPPGTNGNPHLPGGCFSPLKGSNCETKCGNVSVQFPFGLGPPKCYLPGFKLTCVDTSRHPPKLLLGDHDSFSEVVDMVNVFEVTEISLRNNTVHVTGPVFDMSGGYNNMGQRFDVFFTDVVPYSLSTGNELVLIGCNVQAKLLGNGEPPPILSGCSSFCLSDFQENGTSAHVAAGRNDKYCYGTDCCQARISMSTTGMPMELATETTKGQDVMSMRTYALIAKEGWFDRRRVSNQLLKEYSQRRMKFAPIVLDWEILHPSNARSQHPHCPVKVADSMCKSRHSHCKPGIRGYTCHCNDGYDGNPYRVAGGCTGGSKPFKGRGAVIGVASGAGIILLVLVAFFISKKLKHRRAQMLKRKFFEQNRGQLLQQLVSQRADIAERMIISLEELEKATNNFDKARELGGGGHGTVYKGILSDLHVVAIKKPKKVVQKEIDEFINEVAILSQINHRNVVKLYGCCLETEVPMLVYEFISNGTLYDHLHVEGPRSLPWDDRLRIAIETAKSIAYLHSTASVPIIHRDIKSVNILLDDTLTAKVADFGASRYISVEKSGLTTMVQGTIGYLDPMYFYTGRLTEKSDVYSFGVMLVELLTKKKPFSYLSSDGDGLVAHFSSLFAEDNLSEILDPQVTDEGGKEVQDVAALAVACIKLTGDDRPTMRQVELTLENLRSSKQPVSDNVVCKNYEDGISKNVLSTKDRRSSNSMETEFLLSARFPR